MKLWLLKRAVTAFVLSCMILATMSIARGQQPHDVSAEDKPAPVGSLRWVYEQHVCSQDFNGGLPGAVIVDYGDGTGWHFATGDRIINKAFEQLTFDGHIEPNDWTRPINHGLRIADFCQGGTS